MSGDDSDSDEWGTEELVIPCRTTNVPETNNKSNYDYEDDDWEIKLEKKKKPIIKSLGKVITLLKSLGVSPRPKPNIIIASATGAIDFAISIILVNSIPLF